MIDLAEPFDSRPKILNFVYFLLYFPTGAFYTIQGILDDNQPVAVILGIIMGIGSIIISYRFVNKAIMREQLFVTEGHMNYVRHQGATVKFGENIYSWDFQQILGIMKEYGYAGEIATPIAD